MKKAGAFILFVLYLFVTTEAYQVLKFPVILQHFREHRLENKNITFLQFLDIHYMHGSPKDADYDRDMQLPFKTSTHHINLVPVHIKDLTSIITAVQPPVKQDDFVLRNVERIDLLYLSSIFQPPKI